MKHKLDYLKIIKIAAGSGAAIVLADTIGLKYSASAGIITLLSIQDTKKETVRVIILRLISFLAAVGLSWLSFHLLGYGPFALCFFLLLFTPLCILFHMQEGISVNTVLMTHFLTERSMTVMGVGNEALLLLIGSILGVLLNLYIPGKKERIRSMQRSIESQMRAILRQLSDNLSGKSRHDLGDILACLEEELDKGEESAYEEMENHLLSETRYYLRYMNMRKAQALILSRVDKQISQIGSFPLQAGLLAELLEQISASFHEYNNAMELLKELDKLKHSMRGQPLPMTRLEFESRAVLYQILLEMEEFLVCKKEFVQALNPEEIKKFWNR